MPHEKLTHALKNLKIKRIVSQVFYALSIPLAFVSPMVSVSISFIFAEIWLIPDKCIEWAFREHAWHKMRI